MTVGKMLAATLLGSYFAGAMPFGFWIAKGFYGVDIRQVGSGNIGSTNVGRSCGRLAGSAVWILDVLKGFLPPLAALHGGLGSQWQVAAAMLAIIGHNYSVFLHFKGGKGIATSLGALLGTAPLVGLSAFALFGIEVLSCGWVSLGSIIGALSFPPLMIFFYPGDKPKLAFGVIACLLATYKHRANISRLRNGTEPKVALPWFKR